MPGAWAEACVLPRQMVHGTHTHSPGPGVAPAVHLATSRRLRAPAQTPGLGHPGFHKAQASQEPPPRQAPVLTEMTPSAQPPQ